MLTRRTPLAPHASPRLSPAEITLTPATFHILRAWPDDWTDEHVARDIVRAAIPISPRGLSARIRHLYELGLIELRAQRST